MNRILSRMAALWIAIMLLASVCAFAENSISTTVVMRVSRMTQNAVVKAGEDLSIEVGIDGVEPQTYQWFFNDVPLDGANQKVYNIVNAQPEHTGVYRMDAFDANGKMLVSMDIARHGPVRGSADRPAAPPRRSLIDSYIMNIDIDRGVKTTPLNNAFAQEVP